MWREQWAETGYVARLRDKFRVMWVDPLGHGDSDKPHDPAAYHAVDMAGDLIRVLDHEAVGSAVLFGFSAGAQSVLGAASIAPSRVSAVICGSGGWRNGPEAERAWCTPIADLVRSPFGLERFWAGVGYDDPDGVRRGLERNDAEAIAAVLLGSANWRPDYDQLHLPILSYRGDRETLDDNDALMARLGAEVHVLADAAHLDAFSRTDEVLEIVMPFARRHAA
jgi:pimeloyl-ACP methyl ester carboxylesterase